jgi:VanZ family protein
MKRAHVPFFPEPKIGRCRPLPIFFLMIYCLFLFGNSAYLYRLAQWVQSKGFGWVTPGVTASFLLLTLSLLAVQIIRAISRKRYSHLLFLVIVLLSLFPAYFNLDRPLERFHFLEYSVLGVLIFHTFSPVKYSLRFYLLSLNILLLVSYCDEVIQGFVSGRYYDIRDIWINIFSGSAGLLSMRMMDLNVPLPLHPEYKPGHFKPTRPPPLVDLHIYPADLFLLLPVVLILLFDVFLTQPFDLKELQGVWRDVSSGSLEIRFLGGKEVVVSRSVCEARYSACTEGNALDGYRILLIPETEEEESAETSPNPCQEISRKTFLLLRDKSDRLFLSQEGLGLFGRATPAPVVPGPRSSPEEGSPLPSE